MRLRPLALAMLCVSVAPAIGQQAPSAPPAAQTAQPLASSPPVMTGVVRQTQDDVCLEPGHPMYEVAPYTYTHPTMRACIAHGGRRDGPRDNVPLPTTAPQDGATEPSLEPLDEFSIDRPLPSFSLVEPLASQPPASQTPSPFDQSIASENAALDEEPTAAKPPKGIILSDVPSYSAKPLLFRPPQDYIGRSPQDFLP